MAVISKGIKLSYGTGDTFTLLTNLQEIPQIGGTSEAIEITTLEDVAHMYTNGILNYGDSLSFKFLYEKTQFTTLANLGDEETNWKVNYLMAQYVILKVLLPSHLIALALMLR